MTTNVGGYVRFRRGMYRYNVLAWIKDDFPCEYRGEIEVKNRGPLKMYFLS